MGTMLNRLKKLKKINHLSYKEIALNGGPTVHRQKMIEAGAPCTLIDLLKYCEAWSIPLWDLVDGVDSE